MEPDNSLLLEVTNLRTRFYTEKVTVHAVNGVSFKLREGETLGVVGESGSGKSVTMLSILGLIPVPPGRIETGTALFRGKDLLQMKPDGLRKMRGSQIGFVFQDPLTALNPVVTIGKQLSEATITHLGYSRSEARKHSVEWLERVGIPSPSERMHEYPHQLSGGMRQRVMIAIALSCSPDILIADEPTTALDVTIQAQMLDLAKRLRQDLGMAIVWITHDLGVIASLAHRVMVMYGGQVVEQADVKKIFARPQHPYTRGLLASTPNVRKAHSGTLSYIDGFPPDGLSVTKGCPFAPRCEFVFDRCHVENPVLTNADDDHQVACWWNLDSERPR